METNKEAEKLSPTEFYRKTFPKEYSLIKGVEKSPLFNFSAMMQFAEMYANYLEKSKLWKQSIQESLLKATHTDSK